MTTATELTTHERKAVLQKRIRLIVFITTGYNLVEAIIAVAAGTAASSGALIGFGLDSTIEVLSAAAVAWHSTVGIVLTALSVIVMPFLSLAERRTGRELGSGTAVADSKQTLICTYLSAAVLLGLLLNTLFAWWWADPVAALVIVVFAVREGVEAWKGDACATSIGMVLEEISDQKVKGNVS